MFSEIKLVLIIKTKEREFGLDFFEEGEEVEKRPKVRFVQEIRRFYLA